MRSVSSLPVEKRVYVTFIQVFTSSGCTPTQTKHKTKSCQLRLDIPLARVSFANSWSVKGIFKVFILSIPMHIMGNNSPIHVNIEIMQNELIPFQTEK
jgi:hypothetical protein